MELTPLKEIVVKGKDTLRQLEQLEFSSIIKDELAKYNTFYDDVVPFYAQEWEKKNSINGSTEEEKLYTILKELYNKHKLSKAIHYAEYTKISKTPHLFVLDYVITGTLQNLLIFLTLFLDLQKKYTEGFEKKWIDSYKEKVDYTLRDLPSNTPCIEGYNTTLQSLIAELQAGPVKQEESIVEVQMKPEQFKSDGGFRVAVLNKALKDYQLLGISLAAFKISLCGNINNCEKDENGNLPTIRSAYNVHNYQIFLQVIEFYNNELYGTKMFPNFKSVQDMAEMYGIYLPEPNIWEAPQCCKPVLEEDIRGFEGGYRRKKRTRRVKRKNRKTKKRALKFVKK